MASSSVAIVSFGFFVLEYAENHTSGFSPCLKNSASPVFLEAPSRAKYFSPEISSIFLASTPEISTLWEVAIT